MTTDDINSAVMRSITTLLPTQDATDETALSYAELTVSVATTLTNHIQSIVNQSIDNYHTHQTNALAINEISAASIALTRSVQLKAMVADHTSLEDQYAFLRKKMSAMLERQTHMDALLAVPTKPPLDTAIPHTSTIPPSVDQSLPARPMQERNSDHQPQLSNQPETNSLYNTHHDSKHPASYQSYHPDSTNQRNQRARYNDTITQEETSSNSSRPRQQYSPKPPNPIQYQDTHLKPYAELEQQAPIQWRPSQTTSTTYDTPGHYESTPAANPPPYQTESTYQPDQPNPNPSTQPATLTYKPSTPTPSWKTTDPNTSLPRYPNSMITNIRLLESYFQHFTSPNLDYLKAITSIPISLGTQLEKNYSSIEQWKPHRVTAIKSMNEYITAVFRIVSQRSLQAIFTYITEAWAFELGFLQTHTGPHPSNPDLLHPVCCSLCSPYARLKFPRVAFSLLDRERKEKPHQREDPMIYAPNRIRDGLKKTILRSRIYTRIWKWKHQTT